jgi:hypothetical protein
MAALPKRRGDASTALEIDKRAPLMLVAEHGGDTMLPRIGIMWALYPGGTAPTPSRKISGGRISIAAPID